MDTNDFIFGIQRNNTKLLDRFGFEVQKILEDFIADKGSRY